MRKIALCSALLMLVATSAIAQNDVDRHAVYTEAKADAAKPADNKCKGFYGQGDNRSPCDDFCSAYRTSHEGTTCSCTEGKCASDEK